MVVVPCPGLLSRVRGGVVGVAHLGPHGWRRVVVAVRLESRA